MDLELQGKRAIVTGGSRGIGKQIARLLGFEGVDVAIAARDPERLAATAEELSAETGRRVLPYTVDTGDDASVREMVQKAAADLGGVDILVNGAAMPGGFAPPPKLADITVEAFWDDMNVKVMGYIRCAREAAPYMIANGWGRIISLSGMAARQSGTTIGSMRNVSVVAMTKNLADELGEHGINVTVVHPGGTRTERTSARGRGAIVGQHHSAHRRRAGRRQRRRLPRVAEGSRHHRRRHRGRRRCGPGDSLLGRLSNGDAVPYPTGGVAVNCDCNAIIVYYTHHSIGDKAMASITVRNLDDDLKRRLRIRAAEHGCSMEQEARDILQRVLDGPTPTAGNEAEKGMGAILHELLKPFRGVELDILPREPMREPPRFD